MEEKCLIAGHFCSFESFVAFLEALFKLIILNIYGVVLGAWSLKIVAAEGWTMSGWKRFLNEGQGLVARYFHLRGIFRGAMKKGEALPQERETSRHAERTSLLKAKRCLLTVETRFFIFGASFNRGAFFTRTLVRLFFLGALGLGSFLISCSPVGFKKDPNYNPCQEVKGQTCTYNASKDLLEYRLSMKTGLVDILFIDDNSGSMYAEQSKMGQRFPSLLSQINQLDYHIGIITTDVSASPGNGPRSINRNGALQDGRLIPFPNGESFLTSDTLNVEYLFLNTIRRQETLTCEQSNFATAQCPSFDERGIYATNLLIDKNPSGFIRPNAHFAVVILSDEDERSRGVRLGETVPIGFENYLLETNDLPSTLIRNIKSKLGVDKTFSIHAVIVKPGDTGCLNAQVNGTLRGFEGKQYYQLADLADGQADGNFAQGFVGSICENDYSAQMGSIGSKIRDLSTPIQLACQPVRNSLRISFSPQLSVTYQIDSSNRLVFSQPIPKGYDMNVGYDCNPPE